MSNPVIELAKADQELARIAEQQKQLKQIAPFNPLAHLAYEMGTVVEWIQQGKVKNLENKCNTK